MAKIDVKFESNKDAVEKEKNDKIRAALMVLGGTAERHAKERCAVDTGLLRNSITYALDGEPAQIDSYTASNGEGSGSYSGVASSEKNPTVIIGTNVEYAPFIELGHHTRSGSWVDPKAFLAPAITDHASEYKDIVEKMLKK